MKVYRGPSSKPFSDDSHELVAEVDVGKITSVWHDALLLSFNVSKEPQSRQSVAHIELGAEDAIALQKTLLAGLLARSANFDKYRRQMAELHKQLQDVYNKASTYRDHAAEFGNDGGDDYVWLTDELSTLLQMSDPQGIKL